MIYIIESGEYFKIGFATNVRKRMSTYRTHNPNIQLVHSFEGGMEEEKKLHTALMKYHYKLEWFHKFDNWYSVIQNVGLDCGIDFNKKEVVKNISDLGLNRLEFDLAFYCIMQVGMNNSFYRVLEVIRIDHKHFKELLKISSTRLRKTINTLIDKGFLKSINSSNSYRVNKDYIDSHLYIGLGFTGEFEM